MKNFIQRTITGILFITVLIIGILYNSISFGILFAIITALTIFEFGTLVNKQENVRINRIITATAGAYLFFAFWEYFKNPNESVSIFIPYLLLIIYLFVSELYLKRPNPINNWAYSMMSQFYIALPFALLNALNLIGGAMLPLSVFIFIWISDTGAYCTGSLLGKHKLFERISPKKSWEGSIGGGLFAIIASLVLAHFFPLMPILCWIGLAITVVIFGTWGDLIESLIKRQLGIKDSGHILPGHGGMLDRFDSALLAIPAALIYIAVVKFF